MVVRRQSQGLAERLAEALGLSLPMEELPDEALKSLMALKRSLSSADLLNKTLLAAVVHSYC